MTTLSSIVFILFLTFDFCLLLLHSSTGGFLFAETRMIEDYWDFDEVFPESRLASMITLTKAMNGMIVYVPPRVDDSNP